MELFLNFNLIIVFIVKERKLWYSKRNNHRTPPHAYLVGVWKAITALSEHFSLFAVDISLNMLIFVSVMNFFLLYRLAITLYYMVIQLC